MLGSSSLPALLVSSIVILPLYSSITTFIHCMNLMRPLLPTLKQRPDTLLQAVPEAVFFFLIFKKAASNLNAMQRKILEISPFSPNVQILLAPDESLHLALSWRHCTECGNSFADLCSCLPDLTQRRNILSSQ